MLLLGIIFTVIGCVIWFWAAAAQSEPRFKQPLIFYNAFAALLINFIWLGLLILGQFFLWKVSPMITGGFVLLFAFMWISGAIMGSDVTKAKEFFMLYKKTKACHPDLPEVNLLQETARIYFKKARRDEYEINHLIELIFDNRSSDMCVKKAAGKVLLFDRSGNQPEHTGDLIKRIKPLKKPLILF